MHTKSFIKTPIKTPIKIRPLVFLLTLAGCAHSIYAAENIQLAPFSRDISPPNIQHEPISGSQDSKKPFKIEAIVTDNAGIKDVTLFYRAPGVSVYRIISMYLADKTMSKYMATIPSSEVSAPKIEYYLQATDINGNTVVRAGRLFPLSIAIGNTSGQNPMLPENTLGQTPTQFNNHDEKKYWYWVIGGTLAAVVLANSLSDDDGDTINKPTDTGSISLEGNNPTRF